MDRPVTLRVLLAAIDATACFADSDRLTAQQVLDLLAAELRREPEAARVPATNAGRCVVWVSNTGGNRECGSLLPCPLHPQAPVDPREHVAPDALAKRACADAGLGTAPGEPPAEAKIKSSQIDNRPTIAAAPSDPPPHHGAHDALSLLTADRDEWKRRALALEKPVAPVPSSYHARLALSGDALASVRAWQGRPPGVNDIAVLDGLRGATVLDAAELLPLLRAVRRLAGRSSTGDADDAVAEILDAWIALAHANPATAAYAWHVFANQPHR